MIRKIHLDFHTRPEVTGIGAAFDPEQFADTLARTRVNALVTPGKCNFGNIYFDARVGHAHPHLVAPNLFPDTVRACAARGIRVQAYHCVGMDEHTTTGHPDWSQRFKDGTCPSWGMPLVCLASPCVEEVVVPGVIEMIERCPGIVGFWFDICLFVDGAFYSPWFEKVAQVRLGAQANDMTKRWRLGRELVREMSRRLNAVVEQHLPGAENYFNTLVVPGEPENLPLQSIHEVEHPFLFGDAELMTGVARWLRAYSAPTIGLVVSRFQGPWMDPGTLRTQDQLRFDVARAVALGCGVSMGDHRHPDGTLETEVYRRVGLIYRELEQTERWLDGAIPCREAVLLTEIERSGLASNLPKLTLHAARILEEAGIQFDIASVEDPLPAAKLVIWPGQKPGSPELLTALRRHLGIGGSLLAMDAALTGLEDVIGAEEVTATGTETSAVISGVTGAGHVRQNIAGFFKMAAAAGIGADWHGFAQIITQPLRQIRCAAGTQTLAEIFPAVSMEPPFAGHEPVGTAILRNGGVVYIALSLFAEAIHGGSALPGEIIAGICTTLLGRPLVRHSAGTTVVAHLHQSSPGYTLHLVHWALDRWGRQVNPAAIFPDLGPIRVELAIDAPVREVTLLPEGKTIAFEQADGVCRFTVPGLHVWQMVALATGNRP